MSSKHDDEESFVRFLLLRYLKNAAFVVVVVFVVVGVALALLLFEAQEAANVASTKNPLRIFILAGQSNMVGMGSIDHLDQLVQTTTTAGHDANEYREQLWNETSNAYKIKENVYIKYLNNAHGKLTVARDSGYAGAGRFGPELMLGWTIGDAIQNILPVLENNNDSTSSTTTTVLLIKTAWGGKSLGVDFRPPSSGLGNFSGVEPQEYGVYYRLMIQEIQETLSNLDKYVPGYSQSQGYILSGFIWLQGWNDHLSWPMVDEYGHNLVNLIQDVRRDLSSLVLPNKKDNNDVELLPELPVVIGELGMHGMALDPNDPSTPRVIAMRAQEHAVTLLSQFCSNSLFVRTAPFVISNGTKYDGIHHYWGRAEPYFHMGQALGRGALQLLNRVVVM